MKLIYVEWEDAYSMSEGWHYEEDIKAQLENKFMVQESGYVFSEDSEYLVIAGQYAPLTDSYSNITKIPKTWIRKRKVIKL